LEGVTIESIMRKSVEAPCRICGDEHGMLKRVWKGTNRGYDYNCPVALRNDWQAAKRERPSRERDFCPHKFAEECHYDPDTVARKILLYAQHGEGVTLSAIAIDRKQQEILNICDEVRSSWTFTREVRDRSRETRADEAGSGEEDSEDLPTSSKKSRLL